MANSYYGSIDFDKLIESLKAGKLKTFTTQKGKRLINVDVYVKDAPDQYGQIVSISCPLKDQFKTQNENRIYIGNLKASEQSIHKEASFEDDDLPF